VQFRFSAIGALVATLALLSGCGGSSSSDQTAKFKTGYSSARNELKKTSDAIGTAITKSPSQTDAQIGTTFRALATQWQSELSTLQTLKPPSNLAADLNTVTGAVTRVEADLTAIVAAAATHSESAAEQAGASIVTDITAAESADTTLKNKLGIK
jgi:hypothetical protein